MAAAVVPVAEVKLASESTELGQTLKCGNEMVVRSPNFLKAIFGNEGHCGKSLKSAERREKLYRVNRDPSCLKRLLSNANASELLRETHKSKSRSCNLDFGK